MLATFWRNLFITSLLNNLLLLVTTAGYYNLYYYYYNLLLLLDTQTGSNKLFQLITDIYIVHSNSSSTSWSEHLGLSKIKPFFGAFYSSSNNIVQMCYYTTLFT